jgi:hypothetical protein
MKVEFLRDFQAKTTTGNRTITAGAVLDLAEDKANKLLVAGIVKVVESVPFNPAALPYLDQRGRLVIPFDCPPKYRYWAGGQTVQETLRELFEERAGIMQFDGGLSQDEAEQEAARIVNKYVQDHHKGEWNQ